MSRAVHLALAACTVLATAACGAGAPAAKSTREGKEPALGHIHGLGVDPADGGVYAAAHFGVFRIHSAGRAKQVAGRTQDTMGFTITGPRTFLASGHPAEGSSGPPHLGLIRSTDAGVTWTPVSEAGKADLHALQPAGKSLFAYDSVSQQIRRSSDDGRSWVTGAQLEVIDLAAAADKPDRVYATTPGGVQVSTDGGKRFSPLPGEQTLTHLDAPATDVLIGVGVDGQIRTSGNDGRTWQQQGRLPGGPEAVTAFTAVDDKRLLAAAGDTVYESRNGGRDFSPLYQSQHP